MSTILRWGPWIAALVLAAGLGAVLVGSRRFARLAQTGRIRPNVGQPWFPLRAEQHYSVRPPGFVWDAELRIGPFPLVRARDMYREGAGNMLIKAVGLYPIAD